MGARKSFVEPAHPSVYHYRNKNCRCDGCKFLAKEIRKMYPSYKLKKPWYPKKLSANELQYLRNLVGFNPKKDYDREDALYESCR